jgi:hypothetical protein
MNEIRELTEMEVEAVSGGNSFINVVTPVQISTQINAPVQTAVALGGDAVNLINGGLTNLGFQSVA